MFSWLDVYKFHKSRKIRLILLMERNPTLDMVNIPSFARFCTSKRCLLEISSIKSMLSSTKLLSARPPLCATSFSTVSQGVTGSSLPVELSIQLHPFKSTQVTCRGSDHWEMLQQRWKIDHFLWEKRVELIFLEIFSCYCPS